MRESLDITPTPEGVRVAIRVQPRSSRPGVDGLHGTALRVRVAAAPVDGAANEAVIAVLAEALHVSRRAVRIVGGHTSRSKIVAVDGVSPATLCAALGLG